MGKGRRMEKILTLDLGSTYFKAALFDRNGDLCALHKTSTPTVRPDNARCEILPDHFREAISDAIHQLGTSSPDGLTNVVALTFSTQTNTFLLLDGKDQPLTRLISWADERARPCEDRLHDLSQTPDFQYITGIPELNWVYAIAKLLWLRQKDPSLWQQVRRLCLISDYLTLWLTGQHVSEGGAAGLLGIVNIHTLQYWPAVCNQLELSRAWLPTVVRAGTDLGTIRGEVAEELGLPKSCRFVVGCLDQYASAIGAGNIRPGLVSETTGTVLATVRCADHFDAERKSSIYQGPAFVEEMYYQMLFCSTSANLLEWYRNSLPKTVEFDSLGQAAATVVPGSEGLRVRSDADKGSIEDGFIGWERKHTTGHAVRSIMEAVAFSLADQVEHLCGDMRPSQIRACGGAARSQVWLQIKADVLDVPFVATKCPEPTSLGGAMLAATRLGWAEMPDLVRDWVRTDSPHLCNPNTHKAYQVLMDKWTATVNEAS